MIRLFQGDYTTRTSRTGNDLSIMVNYYHMHLSRREKQRIKDPGIDYIPILLELIGKVNQKFPSSNTGINAVIMWLGMVCGVSYPCHTLVTKRGSDLFFLISICFRRTKQNTASRFFRRAIRQINMWFIIWRDK